MTWSRLGALAALGLIALDVAAVPAALPSARLELGSSTSGMLWMQEAYLLALAAVLALAAAAAVDPRLLAGAGVVGFAAGAVLASAADTTWVLVAGRALQGAGTAALLFRTLPGERATVLGALLVLAAAPLLGGAVAELASWRWLFRLELVPAALALLLVLGDGEPRARGGRRPAALAAGLVCAGAGLIQSGPSGWASLDTLVLVAAGLGLIVYARPGGRAGWGVAGCVCAVLLLVPQYFELARGLSPARSGLLMLAVTAPAAILAILAARHTGSRPLLPAGLACAAVGALGATRIDPASSYPVMVLSLAVLGTGAGVAAGVLARPPRTGPHDLIVPAATGAALVVAAAGALFQRAQLDERDGGGSFEDALAAGLSGSAWLLAAILVAAALLAGRRTA